MKGFVKVERLKARQACMNLQDKIQKGLMFRDKGIQLYYDENFTNGSWLTRLWHRNKTPLDFCLARVGCWGNLSNVLYKHLTDCELELVMLRENAGWEKYLSGKIMALANASSSVQIMLGDELCEFVNRHKDW